MHMYCECTCNRATLDLAHRLEHVRTHVRTLTGSASVVYITFGGILWDYAAVLMTTAFAVTLAGQLLTYHIIATFGRRSVIVLAMAVLLTNGASIMVYESAATAVHAARHGWLHASGVCT
jgi:hypothetical protein